MATPKKAVVRKAPARKAPARKKVAAKAKPKMVKKAPVRKEVEPTLKNRAEKVVNIYLGLLGVGYDLVQENLDYARKDNKLRIKELEKRGMKLRKELRKNMDNFEMREFDKVVEDVQGQFDKLQDKLDDVAKDMRGKRKPAKVAKAA
jgi:hypothetical protein